MSDSKIYPGKQARNFDGEEKEQKPRSEPGEPDAGSLVGELRVNLQTYFAGGRLSCRFPSETPEPLARFFGFLFELATYSFLESFVEPWLEDEPRYFLLYFLFPLWACRSWRARR